MTESYQDLRARVRELQAQGKLSKELSREEVVDWAYGNTAIENDAVTREMVENAYDLKKSSS